MALERSAGFFFPEPVPNPQGAWALTSLDRWWGL